MGYDAEWGCISAADCGAPHKRDRIWIVGTDTRQRHVLPHTEHNGNGWWKQQQESTKETAIDGNANSNSKPTNAVNDETSRMQSMVANTASIRQQGQRESIVTCNSKEKRERQADNVKPVSINREWPTEPAIRRVVDGCPARMDRLTALVNMQVSRVAAAAFTILRERLDDHHSN
jgi:DNA (cytosine-5)-methyltransferase 1